MTKKESVPLKITEMNKVGNFNKSYTQSDMQSASDMQNTHNDNSAIGLIDQMEETYVPDEFIAQINKSTDDSKDMIFSKGKSKEKSRKNSTKGSKKGHTDTKSYYQLQKDKQQ